MSSSSITFLQSDMHEGIYVNWASKVRHLNLRVEYIQGRRNACADELSRTIFSGEDCEENELTHRLKSKLTEEGAKWVWKDGKGGFDEMLLKLSPTQKKEVTEEGTFEGTKVMATEATSDWDLYRSSAWFSDIYRYMNQEIRSSSDEGASPLSTKTQVRRALDYRIQDRKLWVCRNQRILCCIPEQKVPEVLKNAHDDDGHFGKESTLRKLKEKVFWPTMTADVNVYISSCVPCVLHATHTRRHFLRPILVIIPFTMLAMDFVGPFSEGLSGKKYFLHVMDYFSRFSWTVASLDYNVPVVKAMLTTLFRNIHDASYPIPRQRPALREPGAK